MRPRFVLKVRYICAILLRMTTATLGDPILERLRAAVTEIYGDRLERVVLFGSRARGDAEPDSDYDVAVFLRDITDRFAEMNRLADVATDIIYSECVFIHAIPYRAGSYKERTPLTHEIRANGIDL
jgi:predicted nucleotidyltransferase